ncbi:hypothetical protein PO909_031563, partial [Leuciscus waleckii]
KREGFELSTHGVEPIGPFLHVKKAALPETRAWCLAGLIIHFSIAGIIEWFGLEKCTEEDCGCFARGGEDPFVWA